MRSHVFALAVVLLSVVSVAGGPAAAQPDPDTTVEGVTVEGRARPLPSQLDAYVRAVVVKEYDQSLVRWHRPICPLAAGLPRDQGEFLLGRVSQVAAEAGAPLAGPGCKPNLYVVFTADPKALLKTWRKRDPNLFGHEVPARVNRFIETDRPVRVWHNWAFESPEDIDRSSLASRRRQPPTAGRLRDSRIVGSVIRNDWGVVVVVDTGRMPGVALGQLADFVAMSALTEIDPDAELGGAPTILGLFSAGDPPTGLSAWDRALLKALYATDQLVRGQRSLIASRMLRDLEP